MAYTEQVKIARGNKANLPAEATLGLPFITLDTRELYMGKGAGQALIKVSDVVFGTTAPTDATKLWIDTTANRVKRHNGTAWVALSAESAAVAFGDITGIVADNAALVAAFGVKADKSTTYTKTEVDGLIAAIPAPVDAYTKVQVDTKFTDLINGAPGTLDTLKELADALATDSSGIAALNTAIATKANSADVNTALAGKADTTTTYTKTQVDGLISAIPGGETITASTGLTKVGSDIRLAAGVAGAGLIYTNGVLSVDVVDGGSF